MTELALIHETNPQSIFVGILLSGDGQKGTLQQSVYTEKRKIQVLAWCDDDTPLSFPSGRSHHAHSIWLEPRPLAIGNDDSSSAHAAHEDAMTMKTYPVALLLFLVIHCCLTGGHNVVLAWTAPATTTAATAGPAPSPLRDGPRQAGVGRFSSSPAHASVGALNSEARDGGGGELPGAPPQPTDGGNGRNTDEAWLDGWALEGATTIAQLDVHERAQRSMLAEKVEDRIDELTAALEKLVDEATGEIQKENMPKARQIAEQTRRLQAEYRDLVTGAPSTMLRAVASMKGNSDAANENAREDEGLK